MASAPDRRVVAVVMVVVLLMMFAAVAVVMVVVVGALIQILAPANPRYYCGQFYHGKWKHCVFNNIIAVIIGLWLRPNFKACVSNTAPPTQYLCIVHA